MSNKESCAPMGLVELTKEFTKLKANRKRLDDLTDRLEIAMDAKALQLKPTPRDQWEREVKEAEVAEMEADMDAKRDRPSAMSDELQEVMKRNQAMWKSGYDAGFKAGSLTSTEPTSEQRDRELLEEHGIDVDGFVARTAKMIEDRDDDDIDEDEPDQYPSEKWGGSK